MVVFNKESGAFEYIGESRPLDFNQDLKPVREVLSKIQAWLASQHRLQIGPIFRSLDKQNHGDLKEP